jgi:hypothetical protein
VVDCVRANQYFVRVGVMAGPTFSRNEKKRGEI